MRSTDTYCRDLQKKKKPSGDEEVLSINKSFHTHFEHRQVWAYDLT